MKKIRRICAIMLGISMMTGHMSYAADVDDKVIASEIILDETYSTAIAEEVSQAEVKKDIVRLKEKISFPKEKLSIQSQNIVNTIMELADEDVVSAAKKLNQIQDEDLYKVALHEVLDFYYGNADTFDERRVNIFSDEIDSRADEMLEDYAKAKEERDSQDILDYRTGEVVATFKDGVTEKQIAEIAECMGGKYHLLRTFPINENLSEYDLARLEKVKDYKFSTIVAITIGLDTTVEKAKNLLETLDCISHVKADGIIRKPDSIKSELGVNDPLVNEQIYLSQIKATEAWNTFRKSGTEIVIEHGYVAVIDTGLDITNDDHKNQYSKDLSISFVNNGENVEIQKMNINNCYWRDYYIYAGHGTRVAGVIAAESNNNKGVVGIAEVNAGSTKIIAINIFHDPYYESGNKLYSFDHKDLIEAIRYAVSSGARVINMSFGLGGGYDQDIQDVIDYAHQAGVVLCASAGNDNTNTANYPSDFNHVISVSGVDKDNNKYTRSNYGDKVDLTATAKDVYCCSINNSYDLYEGTSYSAPMVSAAASILSSMRSATVNKALGPDEIESVLYETATDLGTVGKDVYFGYGLLNINYALQKAKQKFINNYAPGNISAVAQGHDSIKLRWQGLTWTERYLIYRSTDPNGTYTKIASLHCDETWETNSNGNNYWHYEDRGRKTGTRYYYKIRSAISYNNENTFQFSNYTPVVSAVCSLNVPTGLVLTATTGKITASWQKVAGAEGYQVWRSDSKNGTYKRIHTVTSGATLSYGDATVKAGKTYYYKIRAYCKPDGITVFSGYSAIVGKTAK